MNKYYCNTVNEAELIYSILSESHPNKKINITYNYNDKTYTITLTDENISKNEEITVDIPVDLNIEIVYGDSVSEDTPLILKDVYSDRIFISNFKSLDCDWKDYPNFKILDKDILLEKQYSEYPYEVWSHGSWNPIKKIIRHKTEKKLYSVHTDNGCVQVTEDHSLLTTNLEKIKPRNTTSITDLLHSFPDDISDFRFKYSKLCKYSYKISPCVNKLYGLFFSLGYVNKSSGLWYLNHPLKPWFSFTSYKMLWEHLYPEQEFELVNKDLHLRGNIELDTEFFEEYESQFYKNGEKVVPEYILNSDANTIEIFINGVWLSKCLRDHRGNFIIQTSGRLACQGIYFLLKKCNYNVVLESFPDKQIFNIIYSKQNIIEPNCKINKIQEIQIDKSNWVYDIETEQGTFLAGIGEIVVSNTDSIMAKFSFNRNDFEKNRKDTFHIATVCGEKLTNEIFNRPPIEMEFEKVFQPFILLTKKRYIAKKYDNLKNPFDLSGVDAKGIALTRRDYCKMVKMCYRSIIDSIMDNEIKDPEKRINNSIFIFKKYISDIENWRVEIDNLVVSAMLAKEYKTDNLPHVVLSKKLKARKEEVQVGDRIPYIFIEGNMKKQKKSELAEDPVYAVKNKLKFNRVCYLEQLAKPILGFYKIVLKSEKEKMDDLIRYVNEKLINFGGSKLSAGEFKVE